jgi:hypothetical protein
MHLQSGYCHTLSVSAHQTLCFWWPLRSWLKRAVRIDQAQANSVVCVTVEGSRNHLEATTPRFRCVLTFLLDIWPLIYVLPRFACEKELMGSALFVEWKRCPQTLHCI